MSMWRRGRQTCGSSTDIKCICPRCGTKVFVPRAGLENPSGKITITCWRCQVGDVDCDLSTKQEWYGHEPDPHIFDSIYADYYGEAKRELEKYYPNAKFENASDGIHTERFSIEMTRVQKRDYYMVLLRTGFFQVSLFFQLDLREPTRRDLMKSVLGEFKKEQEAT